MTFTYKIPCFDLEQTARSGQVFRMIPAPDSANTGGHKPGACFFYTAGK